MSARKPRCRVGDFAFVIRSEFPENIGRVVRIVKRSEPAEDMPGLWWLARSEGGPMKGLRRDDTEVLTMEANGPDAHLLPIRSGPGSSTKTAGRPKRVAPPRRAPSAVIDQLAQRRESPEGVNHA